MSKPNSLRVQPFASLEQGSYSMLYDDYAHDKLFSVKIHQNSSKGTLKLKNHIGWKENALKGSGEIKLWVPFWETRTLYLKSKDNEVKVHYDHGVTKIKEKDVNLFWSLQVKKNFDTSPVLKAGFGILNEKYRLDCRVRLQGYESEMAGKSSWKFGKWNVDGYKIWDLKTLNVRRNAIQLKYKQNDENEFYLRGTNDTYRQLKNLKLSNPDSYFTHFFFNYFRKVDAHTRTALEAEFSKKGIVGGAIAIEKQLPQKDACVRVRAKTNKSVAFLYEGKIKDYGKFRVGIEGCMENIKYGVQFDLKL